LQSLCERAVKIAFEKVGNESFGGSNEVPAKSFKIAQTPCQFSFSERLSQHSSAGRAADL
jgi:hypothetical protein